MATVEALVYLETSAAAKLLVEEAESAVLAAWLDELAAEGVSDLLDRLDLVELDALTCRTAGLLEGAHLRSLDALHVAAALRADCQTMISYDGRQADAARMAGLHVVAPQ